MINMRGNESLISPLAKHEQRTPVEKGAREGEQGRGGGGVWV